MCLLLFTKLGKILSIDSRYLMRMKNDYLRHGDTMWI